MVSCKGHCGKPRNHGSGPAGRAGRMGGSDANVRGSRACSHQPGGLKASSSCLTQIPLFILSLMGCLEAAMFLMQLLLPRLSLEVPDLKLLQALGSFQGWREAKHPPKSSRGKSQPMRAPPLLSWVSCGARAGEGPGKTRCQDPTPEE